MCLSSHLHPSNPVDPATGRRHPQRVALFESVIGLGAARASIYHFSVIASDVGYLFAAGPKIVEAATFEESLSFPDLGGVHFHCNNGTIDNLASSQSDCFLQTRRFLSYLPSYGTRELPTFSPPTDPPTRKLPALNSSSPAAPHSFLR